jgi:hypothetical protein
MYYEVKRISNSDLHIAKHLIMGTPLKGAKNAFHFGTALHQVLLEPHLYEADKLSHIDEKILQRCLYRIRQNKECMSLLEGSKEQEVYWQDFYTGVECKSKLDIYKPNKVVDLKTTSARTEKEFRECILRYEYDRQMAFYADSVQARYITLIGISKTRDRLFIIHTDQRSELINMGRAKYRFILSKIKELNLFEKIWKMRKYE